jgi:tRNA/rRNA methyltransferase
VGVEVTDQDGEREPRLTGTDVCVAQIVHACHEGTIDQGLRQLAMPGLDRSTLEPVLTYCAELRCEAAGATCSGCTRRMQTRRIDSLDAFVASHREIIVAGGAVRLAGPGRATASVTSLEELARSWGGENYWFWARRVLRKLRHGIRRAHVRGKAMGAPGETPAVILVEPQLAENIGMVARACANFGLDEMRLVAPRDGWPNEKARIAASGANYIIDDAQAFPALEEATRDLHWLAATTARQRDLRKRVLTPEQAVVEMRSRIAAGQRCGVLFGRERNGLETDEIAGADAVVMIPVNSRFASLNLAQSVLLLGYEWMKTSRAATLGRVTDFEAPLQPGLYLGATQPATKEELNGFFQHIESELDRLGYFNPPQKRQTMVRNLRAMFARMEATEQEVRTLRGIVAALAKGKGRARKAP